jgi:hypothetical protein
MDETLLLLTGILLTLIGLSDIFMSILYYEGSGFLSNVVQRSLWLLMRSAGRLVSTQIRYRIFSFAAPLLISITLIFWIGVEIVGFGLIYTSGMSGGSDNFQGGAGLHPLLRGLYLSSVTLPTLGFGDITPATWFYQMVAAIEALIGFALMTLTLSYILNIYRVIQQFRVFAAELFHETADTGDAMVLIRHHWDSRLPLYIDSYFRHIEYMLLDWYENLHQYPIAYYYYSSRTHLSIPSAFQTLGKTISAHYFGTPPTKVFISSPALQSLYNSYCSIMASLYKSFIHKRFTVSVPVEFETFTHQITGKDGVNNEINDFLKLTSTMEEYSGSGREEGVEHLYRRYCQWSAFEHQMRQFTEYIAKDLGYS